MKGEKRLSCLMGATLAFVMAVAGLGCIETAFGLTGLIHKPGMILCLAVCGLVFSAIISLPNGGKWLLACLIILPGLVLGWENAMLQLESLLNKLTQMYDLGYGWGVINWSGKVLTDTPVTWGMILVGAVIEACVAWVVCRRKWVALGMVAGFLPLAACCVVTDTVPAQGYLYLLLSCQLLLLLPCLVRRRRAADGIRLTAVLLVPVLVVMLVLFGAVTPEKFETQSAGIRQELNYWLQKLPFDISGPNGNLDMQVNGFQMDRVELTDIGPKTKHVYAVMDVVASTTDTLYLRGQAMDNYNGTSWTVNEGVSRSDPFWPKNGLKAAGKVEISTRVAYPVKYMPYYSAEAVSVHSGGMNPAQNNDDQKEQYVFNLCSPIDPNRMASGAQTATVAQKYLDLPSATIQKARQILATFLNAGMSRTEKVEAIRSFVESSARYDLNTPRMPQGETDFALWFLENSDTGYCVHFASAAAVLLRASGIPCRYVTGYTVNAVSGRRVTVTAEQAHAWVEYLDENLVWRVLEATPVDTDNSQPRPPITQPTEESTQPTEESTQPTQESSPSTGESTAPSEQTGPSTQATEPGGGADQGQAMELEWLWAAGKTVLWIAGAMALVAAQYWLRLTRRRKRLYTGKPNRQAIWRWRYAKRLGKLLRTELPDELNALADKAAFSQHTLTYSELAEFDTWLAEKHRELGSWPFPLRICIKLIFAIE